jgi:hypothetical protein
LNRAESSLVGGVVYGFDEVDREFKADYKNHYYSYLFGDGYIKNPNFKSSLPYSFDKIVFHPKNNSNT